MIKGLQNIFHKVTVCGQKNRELWIALGMSLLPLLCCILTCAARGKTIADVYLPAGEWNDELFYYKQVEGMVHFGYPLGYFGFNESFALKASFAAWSPVLVFPWILWGLLFGWNLHSPIYCNIFLMMLAMFVFVWLVKPSRKQLGLLTILYAFFTPFTRYMLSGMPECICFSLVIIVFALNISYQKREHGAKLVLLFLLTAVMTLMRPYLILFMVLPVYFWIRRSKWLGVLGSLLVMGVTLVIYALVKHYFGAEYFTPLFDTEWVRTFLDQGIFAGIKYVLWRLYHVGLNFFALLWQGLTKDLFWGEYFAAFMIVMLVILLQTAVYWFRRKEKWNQLLLHTYLSLCFVGMWAALLLMYKMKEGSKHLLTFLAVGIFAISLMETRFYKKTVAVAAVFAIVFVISGTDPYEHQIPFRQEELAAQEGYWQDIFAEECTLERDQVPSFENVMIWVFNDQVDGEMVLTPYQLLYQLPEGYGISCCYTDFVTAQYDQLQSRFLAVAEGGVVDKLCQQKEAREIGRKEGLVVYEINGEGERE